MNRRTLLSAVAAGGGAVLAGCLADRNGSDGADGSGGTDESNGTDGPTLPSPAEPTTTGDCGPADAPLSSLLGDETGDPGFCFEGARPDLAIANERDESVTANVRIDALDASYELEPGERVVERRAFEAAADREATVMLEGSDETFAGRWDARSCYRHGLAVTDDGLEIGWIEPLRGPGDTQHDCYPGTGARLEVGNLGGIRTVTVIVEDRCAGTKTEETIELEKGRETIEDALVNGGNYDVTVDVHDGGEASYEFREGCWGVSAQVEEDGSVRITSIGID